MGEYLAEIRCQEVAALSDIEYKIGAFMSHHKEIGLFCVVLYYFKVAYACRHAVVVFYAAQQPLELRTGLPVFARGVDVFQVVQCNDRVAVVRRFDSHGKIVADNLKPACMIELSVIIWNPAMGVVAMP